MTAQRRMTAKRKRLYLLLGGMAFLGLAAFLLLNTFSANLVYFHNPSDLATHPEPAGRAMRLGGLVETGSVERRDGSMDIRFKITDGAHDVPVAYHGLPPSLFREGQGVIAEGRLDGTGTFRADTILAKHDERYMPKEVVDSLKKSGNWRGDAPAASAAAAPAVGTANP